MQTVGRRSRPYQATSGNHPADGALGQVPGTEHTGDGPRPAAGWRARDGR